MSNPVKLAPKNDPAVAGSVKELPTIPLDRLLLREASQNDWAVYAPHGVTLEDLEDGRLWSTVARQLRAFDLIRVVGHDESWWAEVLVKFSTSGRCVVRVLRSTQLGERILSDHLGVPPGHRIEQGAPGEGWCVTRDADGVVMARGCDNGNWGRQTALTWLLNHASLTQTLPPGPAKRA
ncbi:MAG: hypothetical protein ABI423_09095 [Burkholderiales bacterium]